MALLALAACGEPSHATPPARSASVTVPSASTSELARSPAPASSAAPTTLPGEASQSAPIASSASVEPEPVSATENAAPPDLAADAPQGDTCGLRAKLRALPSTDGFPHYALTLTNGGKKTVRLVLPGDGSEVSWRTPSLTWIATSHGKPAPRADAGRCGLSNSIAEDEIFDLAPGQSREIKEWLGYPRFLPGTYDISVRYRNDPSIPTRKAGMTPAVARKIASSATCDVTTNSVVTTIKP